MDITEGPVPFQNSNLNECPGLFLEALVPPNKPSDTHKNTHTRAQARTHTHTGSEAVVGSLSG